MSVDDIIKQVRLSIDESVENGAGNDEGLTDGTNILTTDSSQLDDIIEAKIGDALRWVCLFAPAELLTGSDEDGTETGVIWEGNVDSIDTGINWSTTTEGEASTQAGVVDGNDTGGRFKLPANFIKLVRVRGDGWHRAVLGRSVLEEDSDEYLQLRDSNGALATLDRPQAAIIHKKQKEIECWPSTAKVEFTCIVSPTTVPSASPEGEEEPSVAIPPLIKTSFIYYLAFLVLSSYNDPRSTRMLEIAKMNLGRKEE